MDVYASIRRWRICTWRLADSSIWMKLSEQYSANEIYVDRENIETWFSAIANRHRKWQKVQFFIIFIAFNFRGHSILRSWQKEIFMSKGSGTGGTAHSPHLHSIIYDLFSWVDALRSIWFDYALAKKVYLKMAQLPSAAGTCTKIYCRLFLSFSFSSADRAYVLVVSYANHVSCILYCSGNEIFHFGTKFGMEWCGMECRGQYNR